MLQPVATAKDMNVVNKAEFDSNSTEATGTLY
jgi:hypothetical protein